MNSICDKCKRSFKAILKEKYLGAMYLKIYMICPHCEKHYLIMLTNARSRILKRLFIIDKYTFKNNPTDKTRRNLLNSFNKFQLEINRINGKVKT